MRQAIFAVIFLALGAGGYYLYDRVIAPRLADEDEPRPAGGDAAGPLAQREVVALGRLEPATGIIAVSAVPGERIERLNVSEGDMVGEEGASLGVLASHNLRQVELEGLRAQLAAAEESHKASLHVAEAKVTQAEAALQKAEGGVEQAALQEQEIALLARRAELARTDYEQLAELAQQDPELVSTQQLARQRLASQTAQSEYEQAQRSLAVNKKAAALAVEAAEADLAAAEANFEQTKAAKSLEVLAKQVEAAALQERWTRLPAPTTGVVLNVFVRPGEFVTETPILQLANLSEMVCIAEVFEADAKLIAKGDEAVLTSDAFSEPFDTTGIPGRVTRVGQLIGSPGLASRDPLARADRHVIEVVIAIDPDNEQATAQAAALVGLQVNVRFLTRPGPAVSK
jgi:HlyD family secretion protein